MNIKRLIAVSIASLAIGLVFSPQVTQAQTRVAIVDVGLIFKKHPQFVCIDKKSQYYFVIIKAVLLPENPNNYDIIWMESFKKHAREKDAKVLYAGVGLGNPSGENLPVYLDEDYLIEYNGIQYLETNSN